MKGSKNTMNGMKRLVESILAPFYLAEIERADMPQVKGKDYDEILSIFDENKIGYSKGKVECQNLTALQDNYIPKKLETMKTNIENGTFIPSPIFVSKEGYILDGHHRWLALQELNGEDSKIDVIKVDLPKWEALYMFSIGSNEVNESLVNASALEKSLGVEIKVNGKNDYDVRLKSLAEIKGMNIVAVLSGRFQPFHKGHYSIYEDLVKKFGKNNTYIATSNKVEPDKSPFNFMDKKKIITTMFDVPSDKVVQVKNPYNPQEILSKYDPSTTAYVTSFSAKDAGRLGGKYFKKWTGADAKGYEEQGYYIVAPVFKLDVAGKNISGTQIRNVFKADTSDKAKKLLFKKLYGKFDKKIYDLILGKLNEEVILSSDFIEEFIITKNFPALLKEASQAAEAQVDDGPATFYKHPQNYKRDVTDITEKLGWQVIDFIAGTAEQYADQNYKYDHVKDVSFGNVGVRLSSGDPLQKYLNQARRFSRRVGYEIVDWLLGSDPFFNVIKDKDNILLQPVVQDMDDNADDDKPVGDMIKENIDFVVCQECGKQFKQIMETHLIHKHQMTMVEYKNKYPMTILVAKKYKNFGDKNSMKNEEVKKNHLKSINTLEYKRPDVTRKNKDPEFRKKVSMGVRKSYKNNINLRKLRAETLGKSTYSDEYREKMYNTNKWTRPDDKRLYDLYLEKVRRLTNENFIKYFYEIPNAKKRNRVNHLDHKYSIHSGFINGIPEKVIAHYKNLEILYHSLNESKMNNNSILLEDLLRDIQHSSDPLDKKTLLLCGGAYGHMTHPFEDWDLTFGDIRDLIEAGLQGKLSMVQEKCLDGESEVYLEKNGNVKIKDVVENKIRDKILSYDEKNDKIEYKEIMNYVNNDTTEDWIEIELENGYKIKVTPSHRMYVKNIGYVKAMDLTDDMELVISEL